MTKVSGWLRTTCAAMIIAATTTMAVAQDLKKLEIIAPSGPGGGWDQAARASQDALEKDKLAANVQVVNIAGAGGNVGLAQFVSAKASDPNTLMAVGFTLISSPIVNKSPVSLKDVRPVARLSGEYEVIIVKADSEFKTVEDLIGKFKSEPGSVTWGGSSAGGTDHVLAALIAKEVGLKATDVNYVAHQGSGETAAAVLGGHISVGMGGVQEFKAQVDSGNLRFLAVASPERLPGIDAATLKEGGVNVELANWRGLVAPPQISDAEFNAHAAMIEKMVNGPRWKAIVAERDWMDLYLPSAEFTTFIAEQNEKVGAILKDLGMAD
jgi:putative tricarboxylic transport membrane protein